MHSLARIGDDLFLEFKNDGMIIRTVNSAQSAYSTFTFNEHFFHSFSVDINDSVKCKISMKVNTLKLAVILLCYITGILSVRIKIKYDICWVFYEICT